jgi:hypothetical protein
MEKRCQNNRCVLPCLEAGACGVNAVCRSVNHKAQCLCPPGYFGNAQIDCKQGTELIFLKIYLSQMLTGLFRSF